MKEVLLLLVSLAAGGCGYLIVSFWMNPLLRYLDVRHAVTSDLIFYANAISPQGMSDEMKQRCLARQEANRRHASELEACFYRLPSWYRCLLQHKGEDPLRASSNLIGLSNSSTYEAAEKHIAWLRRSLRLSRQLDI